MAMQIPRPPSITPMGIVLVILLAATGFAVTNPKTFQDNYKEILAGALTVAATAYKSGEKKD